MDQNDVLAKSEVRGRKEAIVIDLLSNRLSTHILCISADIFSMCVQVTYPTHTQLKSFLSIDNTT